MITVNGKVPDTEYSDLISSTQSFILLLSTETTYLESKTSANELALEVSTFTSFSYRTSVRAQINLLIKVSSNRRLKKTSQINKRSSRRSEVL